MGGVLCNLSVHAGHDPLRVNNNNKEKKVFPVNMKKQQLCVSDVNVCSCLFSC